MRYNISNIRFQVPSEEVRISVIKKTTVKTEKTVKTENTVKTEKTVKNCFQLSEECLKKYA